MKVFSSLIGYDEGAGRGGSSRSQTNEDSEVAWKDTTSPLLLMGKLPTSFAHMFYSVHYIQYRGYGMHVRVITPWHGASHGSWQGAALSACHPAVRGALSPQESHTTTKYGYNTVHPPYCARLCRNLPITRTYREYSTYSRLGQPSIIFHYVSNAVDTSVF